ncbi:MAG: AAA family ATPase [Methylobacter sp.]
MRILAIRGKNLASLAEPFEILLNAGPLEQTGLFAITGHTGAGKSTILDALCLALYDKIPRLPDGHGFAVGHKDEDENLRVTSTDVRSILRRGTGHGYAEVDFIGKDKQHYRARWEVSKARGKVDGRLQPQEVTLTKIDDGQRIGQGKKNTLEAISELIDLNFDQFRRSVLLAQGDFAAFLKAKKDERSSLLERITGTELYSELSIAAFERAKHEELELKQIESRLQGQVPLAAEARQQLEQQRDEWLNRLAELDQQIAANQKIVDWYAELKKLQLAEQAARDIFTERQAAWHAAETDRELIRKVEAAQPLRPLLAQHRTAKAEHRDAEQKLNDSRTQQAVAEAKLQSAKALLDSAAAKLAEAEQRQQQAQPVLVQARALDTRIDVVRQATATLAEEERQLLAALHSAEQHRQALANRQAEQTSALQQLQSWLAQNQAVKTVAAEWTRWDGELERYQTLQARKTAVAADLERLQLVLAGDERKQAELTTALADCDAQIAQHQQTLAQLKEQDSRQSLEDLLRSKDELEQRREHIARALNLAAGALELEQAIKQDSAKLAAAEQTVNGGGAQRQSLNQQQTVNGIQLAEAKKALELIQATTHKNAEQFRALLQDGQSCPVCGALEHPWQGRDSLGNEQAAVQSERVAELENENAVLIKAIAELDTSISQAQAQQAELADKLNIAQAKLEQCGSDWIVLAIEESQFSVTDRRLLPVLKTRSEQLNAELERIKQQEKVAMDLQKRLQTGQEALAAGQKHKEKLAAEYAALDKLLAKNKAGLEHGASNIRELERQQQAITDLLAEPFGGIDNWQANLASPSFRQDCAEKARQFQAAEQQIDEAGKMLEKIGHDQQLAEQALEQCCRQHQQKQAEAIKQTEQLQALLAERESVLPGVAADSHEQTVNRNVQAARVAHQQAVNDVGQAETELAAHAQNRRHWQAETDRRGDNLQKASAVLEQAMQKQAIDVEQLSGLLEKDELWLAEQKSRIEALEQTLQEASALLKIKSEDCLCHQGQPAEMTEEDAGKLAAELQQQKQIAHSQKEECAIRLREDDNKIEAGRQLQAELDSQRQRWEQWEGLNELIGSKNGAKFRTFAQSLTLEALLAHSNRHLEDFARRYALQRVPGSDLELQIIDRDMADDVRSVHSLSGGESFLVSLALALGLASLSSNKTQVESLFIDEGFGSLDPETLDIAIASLDTLQALGRKVGVISHVPILVERIGAKVVVAKQGGGRSRVEVVGGH